MYETTGGARIFQIPLLVFPGMWGFAYLALVEAGRSSWKVLIDAGSGFGLSNQHLADGFSQISKMIGQPLGYKDLTHILITHGHIDHFGGLTALRPQTQAQLGIHELDLRNLTNYDERLTMIARRLEGYLVEAGVPADRRQNLINLYKITKSIYRSVQVDFTFEAAGMRLGPFEMLHTPGHCAGHVVIRLDDFLFCGDHVLMEISPHQSPEILTQFTGLSHYLKSLESLSAWAGDISLALPGHREPIVHLKSRIEEIRRVHQERLGLTLDLVREPHTIEEVSLAMFGNTHGYNVLLAIEEAGAHMEFLDQRGLLLIENLKELESGFSPAPVRYRCLPHIEENKLAGFGFGYAMV